MTSCATLLIVPTVPISALRRSARVERGRRGAVRTWRPVSAVAAAADNVDAAHAGVERRHVLLGAASLTFAAASTAGVTVGAGGASAAELGQEYKDEDDKYAFKVPADWEMATGAAPANSQSTRRVVAFYPAGSPEINVNVVVTSLGADFTKMGSFGSADEFAFGVTAGMTRPRPKQGPKQFSNVINAKSAGEKYFIEYTVERPEEEFYQHLVSSVGVGYNGRGMRLFTITAVCPEDQYAAQKATLKQIVDTFVVPPPLF